MESQDKSRFEILKSGTYPHTAVVKLEVNFSKLGSVSYDEAKDDYMFLEEVSKVLQTGIMWKFNPTCLELFVKDAEFNYNKKNLSNYLKENGDITYEEVDRNNHLYTFSCNLRFLLINLIQVDSSIVNKSEMILITTPMGEVSL